MPLSFSKVYIIPPKRIAYLQFFPLKIDAHIDTGHLHLQSCQGCFGKFLPCGKDGFFSKKSLDYEVILKGTFWVNHQFQDSERSTSEIDSKRPFNKKKRCLRNLSKRSTDFSFKIFHQKLGKKGLWNLLHELVKNLASFGF